VDIEEGTIFGKVEARPAKNQESTADVLERSPVDIVRPNSVNTTTSSRVCRIELEELPVKHSNYHRDVRRPEMFQQQAVKPAMRVESLKSRLYLCEEQQRNGRNGKCRTAQHVSDGLTIVN